MCVIAAKPAGVDMPTEREIETMWTNNPDGAGIMYAMKGKVYIEKGFMKLQALKDKLKELDRKYNLKNHSVVLHFRITTHGGTKPENTHPFPITDSIGMLKKRKLAVKLGVAHNGIISVTPRKGISDTMEYIAGQLAPLSRAVPDFYKNKDLLLMIAHATESKLAFLDGKGKIVTVGEFVENNGIKYSNHSFENYKSWRNYCWEEWDSKDWKMYQQVDYEEREVMWLDDGRGEYVKNVFTGLVADGEYAIDADGNLYEYDFEDDCLSMVYGRNYQALSSENFPLKFNRESHMVSKELVML